MENFQPNELRKLVHEFLLEFKNLIYENRFHIKPNIKNKEGLLELGLTRTQREEIILSLSVTDYNSGPIKDKLNPGYYWVFGKQIEGIEVYIKLKIIEERGVEYAVCFSFHRSESSLKHPYVD
jgi:hypothetical protein